MVTRATDGTPPLYWQLAERLRSAIAEGRYGDGAQLPTEGELGQEFGVSRITVRAALDRLAAEGLIRRERGRGTFVAAPSIALELGRFRDFAEEMAAVGYAPSSRVLHLGEESATAEIAAALDLPVGTPVVRVDRLRLADGQPLAFDRTHLPLRYGRLLDRDALATETIIGHLEGSLGIPIVAGRSIIGAAAADDDLALALAIPPATPVLLVWRTAQASGGEPVFVQERRYRADRVHYALELRRDTPDTAARVVGVSRQVTPHA